MEFRYEQGGRRFFTMENHAKKAATVTLSLMQSMLDPKVEDEDAFLKGKSIEEEIQWRK